MARRTVSFIACVLLLSCTTSASAAVTAYYDFPQWQDAAGAYTTIGFVGYPSGTFITDQYASQGVIFSDGDDFVIANPITYPQDGYGLDGNGSMSILLSEPVSSVAVHHRGEVQLDLFLQDELIYTSPSFVAGGPLGADGFGGLVSGRSFDRIVIYDPFDSFAAIDNLYFGPPIPGPGALALLTLGLLRNRRRRG